MKTHRNLGGTSCRPDNLGSGSLVNSELSPIFTIPNGDRKIRGQFRSFRPRRETMGSCPPF